MKNIALCFDRACDCTTATGSTNPTVLAALLHADDQQLVWSPTATSARRRFRFARDRQSLAATAARASVAEAYEFLVDRWQPGDRIYIFGAGHGASCARALARLLGTVGVLRGPDVAGWTTTDFREYVLANYAMPRTRRSASDWECIARLTAGFSGCDDIAVDVRFLGLWDTAAVPGLPRPDAADPLPNVTAARHAVAIDGGYRALQSLRPTADSVEEVWFRGAHCDVTGGQNACTPLSDIALDWVLDGAVNAGVVLPPSVGQHAPAPTAIDALAGAAHTVSFRKVPADAVIHASVESYLRAHPSYWRRLPARVVWADPEWGARSERLAIAPSAPAPTPVLVAAS